MSWKDRAKKVEIQEEPSTGGPAEAAPTPVEPPPRAAPQHPGGFGGQALANLRGTSQGLTSNFSDEMLGWLASQPALSDLNVSAENVAGQWQDILAGRTPRPPDMPPPMNREQAIEYFRRLNRGSEQAFPLEYGAGQVQGGVIQAASPLGKATPLGQAGLGPAVASGALAGLGASESQAPAGLAESTLTGGALGGIANVGGTLAGRGLGKIPDVVQNFIAKQKLVTPTPEAEFLMRKGVPLTLGQMDPGGPLGQIEGAATSSPGAGPTIKNLRDQAVEGWQRAALSEGLPPGMEPPEPGLSLAEQQARAYEGFGEAYAPTKSIEVPPYAVEPVPGRVAPGGEPLRRAVNVETGFERAAQDPNVTATGDIRESVGRFLKNQMTLLPPESFDPGGRVTVGTLQTLRSNIRDQIRQNLSGAAPDRKTAALLRNAEDYVTSVMEAGMTPEQRAVMEAADQQYARHKVLEKALYRAGDRPEGFTPHMLSTAIRDPAEIGGYARGELGGPLREISEAGHAVFKEPPATGVRDVILAKMPTLAGAAALTANLSPTVRSTMLGQILSDPARVQAMGQYGEQLSRAAARGDDDLAVEHFVLSNTDPEYQRLLREQQGAPTP